MTAVTPAAPMPVADAVQPGTPLADRNNTNVSPPHFPIEVGNYRSTQKIKATCKFPGYSVSSVTLIPAYEPPPPFYSSVYYITFQCPISSQRKGGGLHMGHSSSKEAYWTSSIGTDLKCYQSRHKIGSICPNAVEGVSMVNCKVKSCPRRGYTLRDSPPNKQCTLDSGRQTDSCQAWRWGMGGDPPPAVGLPANMQVVGLSNNFGALAGGTVIGGGSPVGMNIPIPRHRPIVVHPHHRTSSAPLQHFHQAATQPPLLHYVQYEVTTIPTPPINIVRHSPPPAFTSL